MFEQDYIMRMIKEMIRALLKWIFHIDTENPVDNVLEDKESQNTLEQLLELVDRGDINEAENRIYDMTSDGNMAKLQIALLFYSYLNEKDDAFLEEHDFCREEIKLGLEELVSRYGLTGMAEVFLSEL